MRRPRPLVGGPDHRYLRSRGNRRVRKRRRLRTLLRWSAIALIHLTVLAALAYTAVRTVRHLRSSPEFALERIELEGLRRASAAEVENVLQRHVGSNLLDLDLDLVEREVRRDPWIRRASVRRVLPHTLQVKIQERTAGVLALIDARAHLVDTTGFVIGPAGAGASDSLPVLIGLDSSQPAPLAASLRRGARLAERLRRTSTEFTATISEIDLSRNDRITVRTLDGANLLLDPDAVERNLRRFMELRPQIEHVAGSAEYFDLRWRDRISVMPARANSTGEDG